jgi:hypothetical protein
MHAGRYFESTISHPSLLFIAQDLDLERIRQFSAQQQRELRPIAEAVVKSRHVQIESFQRNGSHYPFVDRTRDVATQMLEFLRSSVVRQKFDNRVWRGASGVRENVLVTPDRLGECDVGPRWVPKLLGCGGSNWIGS